MFASTQSIRKPVKGAAGFTLVELLVVAAVMTVSVSLLLPAVQKFRESENQRNARDYCFALGHAINDYYRQHGTLPERISKQSDFWITQSAPFSATVEGDVILFSGYQFQYESEAGIVGVSCEPVAAGLTGSTAYLLMGEAGRAPSQADLIASEIMEAGENRENAFAAIRSDVKRAITQLCDGRELETLEDGSLPEADMTSLALKHLDVNEDGQVSITELAGEKSSILPRRLTASIRKHLRLGAGNEDVTTIPSIGPTDL